MLVRLNQSLLLKRHYIPHLYHLFLNYQMNLKFLMNLKYPHQFLFLIYWLLGLTQQLGLMYYQS